MGQSSSSSGGGSIQISSQFDEPQIFMTKAISPDYRLTIMKTDHVRVGMEAIVIGVDRYGEEIRLLNHWLTRGAQMDMTEEILEKSRYYDELLDGGILEKEFTIKEESKTRNVKVYFVRYPRCSGKEEELGRLTMSFRAVLDRAKEDQIQHLGIPIIQTSTIMTFPKSQFCHTLVKESLNRIKYWSKSEGRDSSQSSKMNIVYLASEMSGCRIMCKELVEYCESEEIKAYLDDDEAEDMLNSSVEFIKGEEGKVNYKLINGKKNKDDDQNEDDVKPELAMNRPPSVARKSFLKSVKMSKS